MKRFSAHALPKMSSSERNSIMITVNAAARVVTLNVGGTRRQTTLGTLTRYSGALANVFSGAYGEHDAAEVFIDQDVRVFDVVLEYARTGQVAVPESMEWRAVRRAFQFYFDDAAAAACPSTRGAYRFRDTRAYATIASWAPRACDISWELANGSEETKSFGVRHERGGFELEYVIRADQTGTTPRQTRCYLTLCLLRPVDFSDAAFTYLDDRLTFDAYNFSVVNLASAPGAAAVEHIVFGRQLSANQRAVRQHTPPCELVKRDGLEYASVHFVCRLVNKWRVKAQSAMRACDSTHHYEELLNNDEAWSEADVSEALRALFAPRCANVHVKVTSLCEVECGDWNLYFSHEITIQWLCAQPGKRKRDE